MLGTWVNRAKKTSELIEMSFGGLTRGSKEQSIRWTSRSDEFICSHDGDAAFAKLLCTLVVIYRRFGMSIDVALEKLSLSGVVQLAVTLETDTTFPHISFASVSFVRK